MRPKKHSKHAYFRLSRRDFIRGASGVIVGAPPILAGLTRARKAEARDDTIRLLTTSPTAIPEGGWQRFEEETGLIMDHSIIKDDPGIFLNEIMVNDGDERFDIIAALAGVETPLIEGGYLMPIDGSRMKNWEGISPDVRDMPYLRPPAAGGKHYGVPWLYNADSFGYFPDKLGEPRPPEEVSWSLIFESEKTLGWTSTGDDYIYLAEAAAYMKVKGYADIGNPAELTPKEAEITADFLIERKKAGQFRNFWTLYDDQVSDILNGEVLATRCWEPAVKEAQAQGLDFVYAFAAEFYDKWMHAQYVPTPVKDSGNLDQVYKALDWFLGGSYATQITPLRGYVNARPDLGIEYAKEHGLGEDVIVSLDKAKLTVRKKFSKDLYWLSAVPEHLDAMVEAMDRVLNA
jgi:spermidine/putrescine-binding protein